ncbi:glycosyltransferase, partial [Patescibacteria group bacterium]|nr:glycosyltransferase [Patescibacteria group bacterium]
RWLYVFDAVKIGRKIIIENWKLSARRRIGNSLVTAQDPFECGLSGYAIAKRFGLPLQLQIHTDFLNQYFKNESYLNRVRLKISQFILPKADCIRVVSERVKNSLESSGLALKAKIKLLPVFVDVKKIQKAPVKTDLRQKYPQFSHIILMASRLSKEKNIGLAIEAMKGVIQKYPKAGLVIVGSGQEKENYSLLVTRYALRNNVIIEPWTDNLSSYYKTANVFLLTSNYEGYCRAVLEAASVDCPVVMTDVGIAGEVLKNEYNCLIVPVGDKEKLKIAILRIIGDDALRAKLIFSSENIANLLQPKEKYLEEYKKSWSDCAV